MNQTMVATITATVEAVHVAMACVPQTAEMNARVTPSGRLHHAKEAAKVLVIQHVPHHAIILHDTTDKSLLSGGTPIIDIAKDVIALLLRP